MGSWKKYLEKSTSKKSYSNTTLIKKTSRVYVGDLFLHILMSTQYNSIVSEKEAFNIIWRTTKPQVLRKT